MKHLNGIEKNSIHDYSNNSTNSITTGDWQHFIEYMNLEIYLHSKTLNWKLTLSMCHKINHIGSRNVKLNKKWIVFHSRSLPVGKEI